MKKGYRRLCREVIARGCGGYQDYWGEYDCNHNYNWSCDECPIVIDDWKRKNHMIYLGLPPEDTSITLKFDWDSIYDDEFLEDTDGD